MSLDAVTREPTPAELSAIDAEWPSIVEDLARLDQEIARLADAHRLSGLDVRRARRARRAVLRPLPTVRVRKSGDAAA